jgi:hypothetical protein
MDANVMSVIGEHAQSIVLTALRVAAEQYDRDAKVARELYAGGKVGLGYKSLAEQFDLQAREARQLAMELEDR